jgi:hypothetical protein
MPVCALTRLRWVQRYSSRVFHARVRSGVLCLGSLLPVMQNNLCWNPVANFLPIVLLVSFIWLFTVLISLRILFDPVFHIQLWNLKSTIQLYVSLSCFFFGSCLIHFTSVTFHSRCGWEGPQFYRGNKTAVGLWPWFFDDWFLRCLFSCLGFYTWVQNPGRRLEPLSMVRTSATASSDVFRQFWLSTDLVRMSCC